MPRRNETLCTNRRYTHHWQPATPLRLVAPTCNDGIKRHAVRIMTKLSRTSSRRAWNYQFQAFLQTAPCHALATEIFARCDRSLRDNGTAIRSILAGNVSTVFGKISSEIVYFYGERCWIDLWRMVKFCCNMAPFNYGTYVPF